MNSGRLVHSATAKLIPDLDATQKKCATLWLRLASSGKALRYDPRSCWVLRCGHDKDGDFFSGTNQIVVTTHICNPNSH